MAFISIFLTSNDIITQYSLIKNFAHEMCYFVPEMHENRKSSSTIYPNR